MKCPQCKLEFTKKSQMKCCSIDCRDKLHRIKKFGFSRCEVCSIKFLKRNNSQKFCSRSCASKVQKNKHNGTRNLLDPKNRAMGWQSENHQPDHRYFSSKWFFVRSPRNDVFKFKNSYHFVRTHKHLFEEKDLKRNAVAGISSIRPDRKKPQSSWKGWRWVSITERRWNDENDLLLKNDGIPIVIKNEA